MNRDKIEEISKVVREMSIAQAKAVSLKNVEELDEKFKSEGIDGLSAAISSSNSFVLQTCIEFTVEYVNGMLSNLFAVEE